MSTYTPEQLSPREISEMEYAREQNDKNREHELRLAELELQIKLKDASWRQLLKIPLALIFLPVKICLAFAVLVAFAFGRDFPDALWDSIKL